VFATVLTSAAFAGCGGCGWGYPAPIAYAPAPVYSQGCGGCGASIAVTYAQPVVYMQSGCGGCGGAVAVTYAQPVVQAVPVMPAPIAVDNWDTGGFGGCGCGSCGGCGNALAYAQPAAAPMYVVNQGPEYSGPGLMVPYGTYSPATNLAAPGEYPYIGARGYGYGPRYGYGAGYRGYRHYGIRIITRVTLPAPITTATVRGATLRTIARWVGAANPFSLLTFAEARLVRAFVRF